MDEFKTLMFLAFVIGLLFGWGARGFMGRKDENDKS